MSSGKHAILSPSKAYQWSECLKSLEYKDERGPSVYAQAGTEAAALSEYIMGEIDYDDWDEYFAKEVLPEFQLVRSYCEYIWDIHRVQLQRSDLHVEQTLRFNDSLFGTPDAVVVGDSLSGRKKLYVVDLKWGTGYEVPALNNLQLLLYAAMAHHEYLPKNRDFDVHMVIYQPRISLVPKEWILTNKQVYAQVVSLYALAADVDRVGVENLAAKAWAGEHCRFCPGIGKCQAHADLATRDLVPLLPDYTKLPKKETKKEIQKRVGELTQEQKLQIFEQRELLKELLVAVETNLLQELKRGDNVPGYKLVHGRSNRKPISEKVWVEGLASLKVEPYKKVPISLGEAEKALGKDKGKLNEFLEKPLGKPTIAKAEDPRTEVITEKHLIDQLEELSNE